MSKVASYEGESERVARKGIKAVEEFLDMDARKDSDVFRQRHMKAQVGNGAMRHHVGYIAASNNREMLRLHRERMDLLPEAEKRRLSQGDAASAAD